MNLAAILLVPFALLLIPFQGHRHAEEKAVPAAGAPAEEARFSPIRTGEGGVPLAQMFVRPIAADDAAQIRIESRVQIRITPRGAPVPPDVFDDEGDQGDAPRRYSTIKADKCVDVAGIVGYRPDRSDTLLLFMRDHRLLTAQLDRSCRARDFYLGFYLSRTKDGKLCVDRDTLLSRSGMNCKLSRIRQVVESDR